MLKRQWRQHDRQSIMIIQLFFLAHSGLKWFYWNKFAISQKGNKKTFWLTDFCAYQLSFNIWIFLLFWLNSLRIVEKLWSCPQNSERRSWKTPDNYHQCPIFSPIGIPSKKQLNAAKIFTWEDYKWLLNDNCIFYS